MDSWEFKGKCPNRTMIKNAIARIIGSGAKHGSVYWGENAIDLQYLPGTRSWVGYGWIKTHSGSDLVRELELEALYA